MADAAAASSDCWTEGLQFGNEAQSEQGHSECVHADVSSSPPLQTGPSSYDSDALLFLKISGNKDVTLNLAFVIMGI